VSDRKLPLKSKSIFVDNLFKEIAETETVIAGKSSWDQANRRQKLGLVWRIRKKISQIIKDYFYLPFYLLIILWPLPSSMNKVTQVTCLPLYSLFILCSHTVVHTSKSIYSVYGP
jgi:hypothetical protein